MSRLRVPVDDKDHVRGPAHAPVTLVEYGDYQCPFCRNAFWILRSVEDRYPHDLRFVYRHFPVTEIHPYAAIAAEAAEAAGAQGRFWEMHDMLYQNQPELEVDALIAYATELDLDIEAFTDDLMGERFAERIHRDFMGGVRSGLNATPCLFLNDVRYEGRVEEVAVAIENARRQYRAEHPAT